MAEGQKKKIKLLYTMKILMERTDENHILNALELVDILANEYEIETERKSVYNDIKLLQEFGIDICQNKGSNPGYFVASRDFELPELKLLVDAVSASRFITQKKSEELIAKIEKLSSVHTAGELNRQVHINERVKAGNETIFYNVDAIHKAIHDDRMIAFTYTQWNKKGELEPKHGGEKYEVSPWTLVWFDENYYLVAYQKKEKKVKYFRVDKMRDIEISTYKREGKSNFNDFDLGRFTKKTFGMFDGEDVRVKLTCKDELAGVILDRFGSDIHIKNEKNNHFSTSVPVAVSSQFFGWIAGLGDGVVIAGPTKVVNEYKAYLKRLLDLYND